MQVDSDQLQAGVSDGSSSSDLRVLFPGDELTVTGTGIRLGSGLVQSSFVTTMVPPPSVSNPSSAPAAAASANGEPSGLVTVTKCGVLRRGPLGKLWVDSSSRRYVAAVDDLVVGVVTEKHGESYRVELGGSASALLPSLAFEGATKRNKPNLSVGALVYCRVVGAPRDMDVELSCTSPHFKKEWVTGQSLYGELVGGYVFEVSSRLARELLRDDCYVLAALGKFLPFELAIGVNGRVWINSAAPLHTILLSNAILNSEGKSNEHITAMVQKIMQAL